MRVLLLTAWALLQIGSAPFRVGPIANALTNDDVAQLNQLATGWRAAPWFLSTTTGMISLPNGDLDWNVRVFLQPQQSGADLRRGEQFTADATRHGDAPRQWRLTAGPYAWAQVKVAGRTFDDLRGSDDLNLPFATDLIVTDAELISIVNFLRTDPIFAAERTLPVSDIHKVFASSEESRFLRGAGEGDFIALTLLKGYSTWDRYALRAAGTRWQVKWLGTIAGGLNRTIDLRAV